MNWKTGPYSFIFLVLALLTQSNKWTLTLKTCLSNLQYLSFGLVTVKDMKDYFQRLGVFKNVDVPCCVKLNSRVHLGKIWFDGSTFCFYQHFREPRPMWTQSSGGAQEAGPPPYCSSGIRACACHYMHISFVPLPDGQRFLSWCHKAHRYSYGCNQRNRFNSSNRISNSIWFQILYLLFFLE